jgi:hypothetical protein
MTKYAKIFIFLTGLFLILGISNARVNTTPVDLSEKIFKIKNYAFFRFGSRGFGFYDWSDGKLKIFNWNLEIEHSIPITIGEGPGEIKPYISDACLFKDSVFLNGNQDKKINVYDLKGKFIKTIITDFSPKQITNYQDKIYLFNRTFYKDGISPLFATILDPFSGKTLKQVNLKGRPAMSKEYEESGIIQILFRFYAEDYLYLLNISQCTILKIDEEGNVIDKLKLPYKFRMDYTIQKDGDNTAFVLSMYDLYVDFAVIKNTIYASFNKNLGVDKKTSSNIEKTYLVKLKKDGKYSQEEFDSDLRILGENQGILYLFDFQNYMVIPVRLSELD